MADSNCMRITVKKIISMIKFGAVTIGVTACRVPK
jgi:hypothetical protein